jgi:alpha-galactosidase
MYISFTVLAFAGIASSAPAEHSKRIKNGVGLTPAMGFNNWNSGLREFI